MVVIVTLGLLGSVLAVLVITTIVFLQTALAGPKVGDSLRSTSPWQPPIASGNQLYDWAVATTRHQVQRLTQTRNSSTARRIAQEIGAGISYAVAQSRCDKPLESEPRCASCRHQTISVSPPEAIAIVEQLRADRPRQVRQIRDQALQNSQSPHTNSRTPTEGEHHLCPLLLKNNICGAENARPIFCRGWLPPSLHSIDTPQTQTITRAVQESLAQELHHQGLDGSHYELNSALTVAFDTLDVAERWARGETVFANCRTV
jgi:hypothetical protein